jgi:hypothetical protein
MKLACMLLLASCWSASPSPSSSPSHRTSTTDVTPTPSVDSAGRPARASLDGTYRVQPEGMCGGAAPPEDYRPPPLAPVAGATLQVFAGGRYDGGKPVVEIVTDKDGQFMAPLSAGRYCLLRAAKGSKPTQGDQYHDLQCLIDDWHRCDLVVDVPVKNAIAFDHYEGCSWASACYNGPPPP